MKHPIYVTKPFLPPIDEYKSYLDQIWDKQCLTNMGPLHQELEQKLSRFLQVPMTMLINNGHMALELAIQMLELQGEVITTPFTFLSTTHAMVHNGLTPVFCDINPQDYTIDVSKIESLITEKTSAILPVHVYGNPCDVYAIDEIAKKYNLKVLYDAAHAFGTVLNGTAIGNFGNSSIYSFHATKVFHTIEGGAVAIHSVSDAYSLQSLRNYGIVDVEKIINVGYNAKLNEFQAAMGLCNLSHISEITNKRKQIAYQYLEKLRDIPGVSLPVYREEVIYNYAYFPVVFDESICGVSRDEICSRLNHYQIYPRKYFYPLTSEAQCYQGQYDIEATPIAKRISRQILALPIYPDLELQDVDRICEIICEKLV